MKRLLPAIACILCATAGFLAGYYWGNAHQQLNPPQPSFTSAMSPATSAAIVKDTISSTPTVLGSSITASEAGNLSLDDLETELNSLSLPEEDFSNL